MTLVPLDVGTAGRRIVALGAHGAAAGVVNASDRSVRPGLIDAHFHHTCAPARPDCEDFTSGTAAAAAGGVTAVLEMPNSVPPVTNAPVLRARSGWIERDGVVDVGLYVSSASGDRSVLADAAEPGAMASKAFLQSVHPGRVEDLAGLCREDSAALLRALRAAPSLGLPSMFHSQSAESAELGMETGGASVGAGRVRRATPPEAPQASPGTRSMGAGR